MNNNVRGYPKSQKNKRQNKMKNQGSEHRNKRLRKVRQQNTEYYSVPDKDTQGYKYTKLIKDKLKTGDNNQDILGRQSMTIWGGDKTLIKTKTRGNVNKHLREGSVHHSAMGCLCTLREKSLTDPPL